MRRGMESKGEVRSLWNGRNRRLVNELFPSSNLRTRHNIHPTSIIAS